MSDLGPSIGLIVLSALLGVAGLVTWNLRLFRLAPPPELSGPTVSVLVAARDEATGIEASVRAACAQRYPEVEVVVLDDGSRDGTWPILERLRAELPRLRVVQGDPLPPGWAGKAWACWQLGSRHALGEWLLFVDADVRLEPDAVGRALSVARQDGLAFASAFPRQLMSSPGEALLIPLIYLVLLAYLPMALLRRVPVASLSAGCGQFMLVRRDAYLTADGHRAIRATRHDGIMLARRMKAEGLAVGVFDGQDVATCRMYAGLAAAWRGFSRNAYEALGSPLALAGMVGLNGALFVLPFVAVPLALLAGEGASVWALAAGVALAIRAAVGARFGAPRWTVPLTPVAVALMIGIQLHSYLNHVTGRNVLWRGRAYPGAVPSRKG